MCNKTANCKKNLRVFKKSLTATRPTSLNENSKNQKGGITKEHADMAMCCKSYSIFFAVLYSWVM